jgi:hypothetical protein
MHEMQVNSGTAQPERPHEDAVWRSRTHQEYRDWLEDDLNYQLIQNTIKAALAAMHS